MALVFPRALPDVPLACEVCDFLVQGQDVPTLGGNDTVVETGTPIWYARYATPVLRGEQLRTMEAWLASIKSPPQFFWARDTRARYPRAYQGGFGNLVRTGGSAFDGTCNLASLGSDGVTIGLSLLPAGFKLGAGDLLSFAWSGTRQAYHRVVSPSAAADESGALAVEVRPALKGGYATGVPVLLDRAVFKAKMLRGSDRVARSKDTGFAMFSFEARQVLTP